MTFSRQAGTWPVPVAAHVVEANGQKMIQFGIGNSIALLSEDDAASLGGYLLGITNNDPAPDPVSEGQLELPAPADPLEE